MAYYWSKEYGGRCVIVAYWQVGDEIRWGVTDARRGELVDSGASAAPDPAWTGAEVRDLRRRGVDPGPRAPRVAP